MRPCRPWPRWSSAPAPGWAIPRRPQGVFLFAGPTGVGKTELALALAEALFDDQDAILRLDMSEYMEKHQVARLIGSPPGYIGYEEEGQLTGRLRRRPYSVVLLDEMEKAHADVQHLFLQLFDAGRLTDSRGHVADGRNAIFIMTTNLGTREAMGLINEPADLRGKAPGSHHAALFAGVSQPHPPHRLLPPPDPGSCWRRSSTSCSPAPRRASATRASR